LQSHKGNVAAVARDLGCPRKNIYRWLEELSLDPDSFRE
jgi:DNA-binding NtrC family response regulator